MVTLRQPSGCRRMYDDGEVGAMETPQPFQTGIPRALRRSPESAAFSVAVKGPQKP
jgi:hypothetical protein